MTTLNFNIGVLGHVDSGKTSLAKALSTVASTACFDKNPQSKQRGITLDLGFSSFTVQSSEELKSKGYDFVQYTLVDCPGHASLIKTIIGGAQIIDMMMLVIDIVKGVQTQTAECLIIGEICCDKMLIVLNKLDLVEESKRANVIEKMSKRLLKTLENTKFANSPIVSVAANQSTQQIDSLAEPMNKLSVSGDESQEISMLNIDVLIDTLRKITFLPEKRSENGPLLFAVDHCFTIKGQGAVMTGTILNGSVKVNDTVEIPVLKTQKKVKSIQVFRKPVEKASQGDRCGVCLAGFDAKQFERGIVCSPNHARNSYAAIIEIEKIKHFKGTIESGSKFHITIGHETILGKIELFCSMGDAKTEKIDSFDFDNDYLHLPEYPSNSNDESKNEPNKSIDKIYALIDFAFDNNDHSSNGILCVSNSLLIGSKLDTDIHLNQCRIAFYGHVLHLFSNKDFKDISQVLSQKNSQSASNSSSILASTYLSSLKVYKEKSKEGQVERKHDEYTVIGKSLFKKETNIDLFVGLRVTLSTGEKGVIEGSFGQSGKFKVRIPDGLLPSTKEMLDTSKSKKKPESETSEPAQTGPIKIYLNFKRFIYDEKKKMIQ